MNWIPSTSQILQLVLVGLAWYLYKSWIRPYRLLRKLGLKVPFPKPIVGNLMDYHPAVQHLGQLKNQEKYGRVYGGLFFSIPAIWVSEPNLLKSVCIKNFSNFSDRYSLVNGIEPFGEMLLELKGTDWKRIRNILLPTFSASKLKAIMAFIDKAGDRLVATILKAEQDGQSIDLWRTCGKFTMEVILATAFGIEFESKEHEEKLTNAARGLFEISPGPLQFLLIFAPSLFRVLEPKLGGQFMNSTHYLVKTCKQVIKERRRNMAQGIACRRDILQQMLEAGDSDKLNDQEVVAQALLFLAAGYETTANALAFATHSLATNPEIQQRVFDEISDKLSETDSVDYDSVGDLPYLEMVIAETLRMYPPVFHFNRDIKEDMEIDGLQVSKEAMIGIPVYAIHHDPKIWPEPEQFRPERFTSEEKSKRDPCTYLPFGNGPRNCIGMRLAMVEVKLAIVKILQKVELIVTKETDVPIQLKCGTTLSPANGVHVGFRKR
ncbi:Cytochrome P450 3A11 [Trichoplax sp. H2]|nr:Cytochrome P450 3A11 [Trichoplax sp. H2]|eukprot:RDD39464.1 Cytochrome P450 3A11 [Trichoplax sp. H2]